MSNEVSLFQGGNIPAYLKNRALDDITKSLIGGNTSKRISIRGGVFRMISGGKEIAINEERSMKVVIVNAAPKVSRSFYEGTYDPDAEKAASPTCWSADSVVPDKDVFAPQHSSCADCPQNVKGSGQGESRACRFQRRLAVVLENDLGGDVFQLALPATSIFGKGENGKLPLNAYASFLAGFNVPITAVVTELRFDTSAETPKLTFKAARPLTEEEFNLVQQQGQTPAAKQAVTFTVAKQDGVKQLESKPQEKKPEPKAEKKAEKQATPEPTKRESKSDAAPTEKKELSDLVGEWDDD